MARPGSALLFGIDFGTTYSGVAWELAGRKEENSVIRDWGGPVSSHKVPTQIHYDGRDVRWGFNIPEGVKPLRFFKLLLLSEEDLKKNIVAGLSDFSYIEETKQMLTKLNKSAEDVVTDYLRLLWQHALKDVIKNFGREVVEASAIHVILTYPAIWPAYAQNRMKRAAENAGIKERKTRGVETTLGYCAEPEAAALAVMQDKGGEPVLELECFVICDVGGGTADLISYQVEDTYDWKLSECASGAGRLCGAVFVDEAFEKMIGQWTSPKAWKTFDPTLKMEWLDENWERHLKRTFDGSTRVRPLKIPPYLSARQEFSLKSLIPRKSKAHKSINKSHQMNLTREEVAEIFDPCVKQIVALVEDQVAATRKRKQKSPKAVILVGGFGRSLYLHKRIEDAMSSQNIDVLISREELGWTAVCRGARERASIRQNAHSTGNIRRAVITSHVVRKSYGMTCMEAYDPSRHLREDMIKEEATGHEMAEKQMDWYIKKNADVRDQQGPITRQWCRRVKSVYRNQIKIVFYECDINTPPSRQDENVKEAGHVIFNITKPLEDLPSVTNNGSAVYRVIQFDVEMRISGTILEFTAIFEGQRSSPLRIDPPFADPEVENPMATPPLTPTRSPPRRPFHLRITSGSTHAEPTAENNHRYEIGSSSLSLPTRSLRSPPPPPPVNRLSGNTFDSQDDD